ncbi:MAG: hypothetical protein FWD44_01250 [Oscillospiraceae bacterium]|nr:hypothetical protein [Oscillospiraceae bacterium]
MDERQIANQLNGLSNSINEYIVISEKLSGRVDVLTEKIQVAEKRLQDNDQVTNGVYELSKNVAIYAKEVEHLAKTMDKRVTDIEERQQKQGERIGSLELRPAKRMELIITTIVTGLVTLGLGLLIGHFW